MPTCAYCSANALYRERTTSEYLCSLHARLEVVGPDEQEPQPPLTIRSAAPADRPRIAELAVYFWDEVEVACFDCSYQVDALPACVACDGDEIVGLASYAHEGDALNLVMLNVLPQWQGRGAAQALIEAVVDRARSLGTNRVLLATTNDNLPALALYQRAGFTITQVLRGRVLEHHGRVEPGFAGIPVRDEIQMELRL